MDVILLQDVPKVGHKYEVKKVAAGYAQNHLFPRKLAERASKQKIAELAKKRDEAEKAHAAEYDKIKKMFADLHGSSIHITANANEQGHLFQGLKTEEIAHAINEKQGTHLTHDNITRQEAIKDLGEYELELEHDDLKAKLMLVVKNES